MTHILDGVILKIVAFRHGVVKVEGLLCIALDCFLDGHAAKSRQDVVVLVRRPGAFLFQRRHLGQSQRLGKFKRVTPADLADVLLVVPTLTLTILISQNMPPMVDLA